MQRDSFVTLKGVVQPASAPKFSEVPVSTGEEALETTNGGANEVLERLGYSKDEILEFIDSQVVSLS